MARPCQSLLYQHALARCLIGLTRKFPEWDPLETLPRFIQFPCSSTFSLPLYPLYSWLEIAPLRCMSFASCHVAMQPLLFALWAGNKAGSDTDATWCKPCLPSPSALSVNASSACIALTSHGTDPQFSHQQAGPLGLPQIDR